MQDSCHSHSQSEMRENNQPQQHHQQQRINEMNRINKQRKRRGKKPELAREFSLVFFFYDARRRIRILILILGHASSNEWQTNNLIKVDFSPLTIQTVFRWRNCLVIKRLCFITPTQHVSHATYSLSRLRCGSLTHQLLKRIAFVNQVNQINRTSCHQKWNFVALCVEETTKMSTKNLNVHSCGITRFNHQPCAGECRRRKKKIKSDT